MSSTPEPDAPCFVLHLPSGDTFRLTHSRTFWDERGEEITFERALALALSDKPFAFDVSFVANEEREAWGGEPHSWECSMLARPPFTAVAVFPEKVLAEELRSLAKG